MSDDDDRAPADRTDEEGVALQHAADRLAERFPAIPRERIDRLVGERRRQFDGATVRDFVPVLIEHDVKAQLRTESEPAG